jgi:hypothetical protein
MLNTASTALLPSEAGHLVCVCITKFLFLIIYFIEFCVPLRTAFSKCGQVDYRVNLINSILFRKYFLLPYFLFSLPLLPDLIYSSTYRFHFHA